MPPPPVLRPAIQRLGRLRDDVESASDSVRALLATDRDRRILFAVAAALAASVLLIGGAPRWATGVVAALTGGGLAMVLGSRRHLSARSPLLLLLLAALGMTLVQLVPLPAAILAALDPTGHTLLVDGAAALGQSPPMFAPLSLDPGSTAFEAGKLAAYLGLAYLALRISVTPGGRARLVALVALAAGVAAVIAVVNRLLGADILYGLYEPRHIDPSLLGPLLNPNHLGSLLAIGTLAAAGLALRRQQTAASRSLWVMCGLTCLSICLLTASRGAALGLVAGGVVLGISMLLRRRKRRSEDTGTRQARWRENTVAIVVLIVCSITLAVVFGGGNVRQQLATTEATELLDPRSKFAAWGSATQLVAESPWVGIGRGAFESAFTRVHPASAANIFTHVENEYLQAAIDWGVPGALALGVLLAWTTVVALRRRRDGALASGALAALVALAAQSFVDFGVELPGIAVPAILLLATLTYVPLRQIPPAELPRARRLRLTAAGAYAFLFLLLVSPLGKSLHSEHETFRTDDATLDEAHAAVARHPLDYLSYGKVAEAMIEQGKPPSEVLNHALRLHPTHVGLHRLAGRLLARVGRGEQARVEYRSALRYATAPRATLLEVLVVFPLAADAVAAIPPDLEGIQSVVRTIADAGRTDVAAGYLRAVLDHDEPLDPVELETITREAQRLEALDVAEDAAVRWAKAAQRSDVSLIVARIQLARGRLAEAEATLELLLARPLLSRVHQEEAHILLAELAISGSRWEVARARIAALRALPGLGTQVRRRGHLLMATVEKAVGDSRRAAVELEAARVLR